MWYVNIMRANNIIIYREQLDLMIIQWLSGYYFSF